MNDMGSGGSINPYASPRAQEPYVPTEALWRIEGLELWVRNGAHLPDVDLATGEIRPREAVRRKITRQRPGPLMFLQLVAFSIIPTFLTHIPFLHESHLVYWWWVIGLGFALCVKYLPARWGLKEWMTPPPIIFSYDETGPRARKRRSFAFAAVAVLVCFLIRSMFIFDESVAEVMTEAGVFAVPVVGLLAVFAVMSNRPRPGNLNGEWLRVDGVAPVAVEYLRGRENEA